MGDSARHPDPPGRARRLRRKLTIAAISLAIGLGATELTARLIASRCPPAVRAGIDLHASKELVTADPELGHRLLPGASRRVPTSDFTLFEARIHSFGPDAVGVRDAAADGPHFGVVIGDSFAFGWGVAEQDGLVDVVEHRLERSFLNLGVYGYGPQQEGLVLRSVGLAEEPKFVVWLFYGNDLDDAAEFEEKQTTRRVKGERSALDRLYNTHCVAYKLYRYAQPRHLSLFYENKRVHWRGGTTEYAFAREWQNQLDLARPRVQAGLTVLFEELGELYAASQSAGFEALFVLVPLKEQIYAGEYELASGVAVKPAVRECYEQIAERARTIGLDTLDLFEVFEAAKERQIYFRHDPHLTAEGNRLAGETIAEHLAARLQDR